MGIKQLGGAASRFLRGHAAAVVLGESIEELERKRVLEREKYSLP